MLSDESQLKDAKTAARWIIGEGQRIYWRSYFIYVFEASNTNGSIAKYDICDGQAIMPSGIELFVGGKDGKVKF